MKSRGVSANTKKSMSWGLIGPYQYATIHLTNYTQQMEVGNIIFKRLVPRSSHYQVISVSVLLCRAPSSGR